MEKIRLLLYCNRQKPYLIGRKDTPYKYYLDKGGKDSVMDARDFIHNGKIVVECDFEVEEINDYIYNGNTRKRINTILKNAQMLHQYWFKLYEYEKFYRIHINNLNIFDKPRELSDYCLYPKNIKGIIHFVLEDIPYILLSVSPEEMCRICNGEQTDLFKKRVLKEML